MPSSIKLTTREAALLWAAGQSTTGLWVPPTGDYEIALIDGDGEELETSTGAYARAVVAVTGCWELVGAGTEDFEVVTAAEIQFDEATAAWSPVHFEHWYRTGEAQPDFIFQLTAPVTIPSGGTYTIQAGSRKLRDDNA